MIAVIETIVSSFSHEAFNSGMLYQLHRVYPNEEIVYFCEKEQAKYVKKILDRYDCKMNIRFSYINRTYINYDREDIEGNKEEYIRIFKKCSNAKFVMILTMEAVNSGLLKNLMKKFPHLKFGICIHGVIEYILPQKYIEFEMSYKLLYAIKDYKQKVEGIGYFKNNLKEMAALPNCNIILYSNIYKKYKDDIDKEVFENIKVLNLPYVFDYDKKAPAESNELKIGIMPTSAAAKDKNCIKLIEYMLEQKYRIQYPYLFLIFNYHIESYENVKYINSSSKSREDVDDFMEKCDWMLIPYDENKYILSSSGVMFDSINAERPIFVLGSPSFYKAIGAGCGIQETSIESLGERIIQQINNRNSGYEKYYGNVRKYKRQLENENLESIAEIFGK